MEDGIVDDDESSAICDVITEVVGDSYSDTGLSSLGATPTFRYAAFEDVASDLSECCFVLTGNFRIKPRRKIEEALKAKGAEISKTFMRKTTHLIVALEASRDWIETHQGLKIKKAREYYQDAGQPLILAEFDVTRALDLS
ncbi:BRCT domain-containing protein [Jannaschia seosinensis]|uniref:BRCT domain-containing protein n=1 Tax=Jannaschia seosinensis TaxID=313367 RepID=UPI0006E25FA2|nr:BRCT domain-containing protein [Jannaschia seosinensis]